MLWLILHSAWRAETVVVAFAPPFPCPVLIPRLPSIKRVSWVDVNLHIYVDKLVVRSVSQNGFWDLFAMSMDRDITNRGDL